MKTLVVVQHLLTLVVGLLFWCGISYADNATTNSATSTIEILNDYDEKLDIQLKRDYQPTPGVVKHAPTILTTVGSKKKSKPLDIGNIPNSCFTLSIKAKDGKWRDFTCVLEFPNIPPYKTEVMCESDVGGDMYLSASGSQIRVYYVTPAENTSSQDAGDAKTSQ